jgi:hypothetical protein
VIGAGGVGSRCRKAVQAGRRVVAGKAVTRPISSSEAMIDSKRVSGCQGSDRWGGSKSVELGALIGLAWNPEF